MAVASAERPVRLVVVDDDLRRTRLTVFFRLVLALPLLVWMTLRGIAAFTAASVLWLAVLIEGRGPTSIHDFVANYIRYSTQVGAYVLLAADPYPWFRVQDGYPIDVRIAPPAGQSRWTGFFRIVLAIPAIVLSSVLGGGVSVSRLGAATLGGATTAGVAFTAALLAWFAVLARGRTPRGLRDLVTYALGYGAQTSGYLLLLTGRYPSSDPAHVDSPTGLPRHPVRLSATDELRRSRVTVFFRLLLAIPHLVWFALWSIAGVVAVVVAWLIALVTGRVPSALHWFLAAYVRYSIHLYAFVTLIGGRFPGFTGKPGAYGIDAEVDGPARQHRLKTLFRLVLVVPASLLLSALGGALLVVALFGWWLGLLVGRMPEGLRNLGASCLRYHAQAAAYTLLLTDRYPYAAPMLVGRPSTRVGFEPPLLLEDAF